MDELELALQEHQPPLHEQHEHRALLREEVLIRYESQRDSIANQEAFYPTLASIWLFIMKHPALGFSAASFVLMCGAAVWALFAGPSSSAYAQLVEPLLKAKSGRFVVVYTLGDKELGRGPGYFDGAMSRVATPKPNGAAFTVFDGYNGKVLEVSDKNKTASLSDLPFFERDRKAAPELMDKYGGGMLGAFRMYLDPACDIKAFGEGSKRENIEEPIPGGGARRGVRITTPGMTQTLWANPKTGEPDRVEIEIARLEGFKTVLADFEFGVDVDSELLTMEPPEGYDFVDRTDP